MVWSWSMIGNKHPGRPRGHLSRATHVLTHRVRKLVDLVHHGKVRDASRLTGVPYPTLNDLYIGRTVNPNLATLERLREPYGVDLAWLVADSEPERQPDTGLKVYLPPHPKAEVQRRTLREIEIPYAAWSMFELFSTLEAKLEAMPPGADRPIVADASGDALLFRLATFLFQPLLSAEKAGEDDAISTASDGSGLDVEASRRWAAKLEALGAMWRVAAPMLLGEREEAGPGAGKEN